MKLLGVVVLYYPDGEVVENIKSYLSVLDALIVWDNTPLDNKRNPDFSVLEEADKLIQMGTGKNEGIGKALNEAMKFAQMNQYSHLLTMDQDSSWKEGIINRYLEAIKTYGPDKKAIFSTNYYIKSQQAYYYSVTSTVDEVSSAMTSGTIYPVALLAEIGTFWEELFVWGIDCEYCWRGKRRNIPTLCFKEIILEHNLGYQKKKRHLLGKEVFPNEYGPARSYYNVRNGIILHKKYPEFLNLKAHLRYHFYKRIVFVLLYENQKMKKLKALLIGLIHGKQNRLGEIRLKF